MELAITAFMTSVGFTMAEIMKMLVLVGINFVFLGVLVWRLRKPIIELYTSIMEAMKSIPEMKTSMKEMNATVQEHIVQTGLRMESGDERFLKIESRLLNLETKQQ